MKKVLTAALAVILGLLYGGAPAHADYVTSMNEYVGSLNEILEEHIPALIDAAEEIETEEDLEAWSAVFMTLKQAVGSAADSLAEVAGDAPEEYRESHVKITIATAAVYDAMSGFEAAVDAAIDGDEDALAEGLGAFVGNVDAAKELWSEAVQ